MKCNAVVGGDNNDNNDDDRQPTRPSSRKNGLKAQTNIMSLNFIGKKSYYITKKEALLFNTLQNKSNKVFHQRKNIS